MVANIASIQDGINRKENVFHVITVQMDLYQEMVKKNQILVTVYLQYDTEAWSEWRGPSTRLSAWATQLRRNVAAVVSRWWNCADFAGPEIEPQTFRTDGVRLAADRPWSD